MAASHMSPLNPPPNAIQRVLFVTPTIHVYQIPPLTSNRGHVAAGWTQNPRDLIFTGRLRILETATPQSDDSEAVSTSLLLEDKKSGELFAEAPFTSSAVVQQAVDSSRFFAVRVVGEGGMKATLGIGFEDRSDAFDFGVALQEAGKVLGFDKTPGAQAGRGAPGRRGAAPAPEKEEIKRDFRLKEGETITVNIGGKGRRSGRSPEGASIESAQSDRDALFSIRPPPGSSGGSFLPPPPSASDVKADRRRSRQNFSPAALQEDKVNPKDLGFDDGEFGEFQ